MTRIVTVTVLIIFIIFANGVGMAKNERLGADGNGLIIRSFERLYEPSAVVSLPGGDVMVFEDEGQAPSIHRVTEDKDGLLLTRLETTLPDLAASDIEGAALGKSGIVVAMTSHSKNREGQKKNKREKIVYLDPGKKSKPMVVSGGGLLKEINQYLATIDSSLQKKSADLNIEGISFTADEKELLIGLRTPVYQHKAIVVKLTNPYELASKKASPQLSQQKMLLDLGGAGVRALTYDKKAGLYFVVSEVETKKGKMRPRLWAWNKETGSTVRMVFTGVKKLRNVEGITIVEHKNRRFLLLVCDDGKKKKREGASYVLVDIDQIERHS
ncbi:DUF3616 domain-containing protein [Desulforhopalus sp. 52FAK]